MSTYYVNKNAQSGSGVHEVHKSDCSYLPNPENRISLGIQPNCKFALQLAKTKVIGPVDGCYYCSKECHTR